LTIRRSSRTLNFIVKIWDVKMTKDVQYVDDLTVSCDGNSVEKNAGHPRVYLNLGDQGTIQCPYCSQMFIFKK